MGNELSPRHDLDHDQMVGDLLFDKIPHSPDQWTIIPTYHEGIGDRMFVVEGLSTRVSLSDREYEVRIEHYDDVNGAYGKDYRLRVEEPGLDTVNTAYYFLQNGTPIATAYHLLYGTLYTEASRMGRTRTEADLRATFEAVLTSDIYLK